ncbi:MAG: hypothetical protein LLG04_13005 [Parachlamydia sp.]|nr:hypothetical protein [Parachlamydia sp.]
MKFTTILTWMVLIGMGIILMLNFTRLVTQQKNERYLSYNGVRGMALEHGKQLWTLSFEQQNKAIEQINLCLSIGKSMRHQEGKPIEFGRIVIYRFNAPDIYLTPIAYDGDNLIFESKEWNPDGYLLDVSGGAFDTLLRSTYDP